MYVWGDIMNLNKKNTKQIMILIAFAAFMYWVAMNYMLFVNLLKFIFKIILPIIVGIAISFIVNVPMKQIENKLFKINKRKHKKLIRGMSLILSFIFIFGIISVILILVIPEVVSAISILSKNLPKNFDFITNWLSNITTRYPAISDKLNNFDYKNIIEKGFGSFGNIFNYAITFIRGFVSRTITFFIGLILSIYILGDKEGLARSFKKVLYALFNDKIANNIIKGIKLTNDSFTKFLTGQFTDACLLGLLCFICMSILRLPYALIISVLLTVTALIPFIGAFITLVSGALLIAVISPIKSLIYIILFFILQQFDDNLMYPRVVGKSVGLPPIIALIAVTIGGSIFGFLGMIISIPLASILYGIFKQYIEDKLLKKNKNI